MLELRPVTAAAQDVRVLVDQRARRPPVTSAKRVVVTVSITASFGIAATAGGRPHYFGWVGVHRILVFQGRILPSIPTCARGAPQIGEISQVDDPGRRSSRRSPTISGAARGRRPAFPADSAGQLAPVKGSDRFPALQCARRPEPAGRVDLVRSTGDRYRSDCSPRGVEHRSGHARYPYGGLFAFQGEPAFPISLELTHKHARGGTVTLFGACEVGRSVGEHRNRVV
jgi:hypothetical protein